MVSEERQRTIEANRSLRLIKNELESLLEKGIIDDDAFDKIHSLLPSESSLSGSSRNATPAANRGPGGLPTPAQTASPAPSSPPTASLSNLNLGSGGGGGGPPSYAQTTGSSAAPPPGPPPPSKPVLCHARALYRYAASDARDCSFERDDRIAVHEYMNPDWWMGRNLRTGHEGIFPRNYVQPEPAGPPPPGPNGYVDEKSAYMGGAPPPQPMYGGGGYPPAPAQQNPYNANVPPMAVAEQGGGNQQGGGGEGGGDGGGKAGEMGKKFGKKLGNAAIFGAGATLGGNLVNSIF